MTTTRNSREHQERADALERRLVEVNEVLEGAAMVLAQWTMVRNAAHLDHDAFRTQAANVTRELTPDPETRTALEVAVGWADDGHDRAAYRMRSAAIQYVRAMLALHLHNGDTLNLVEWQHSRETLDSPCRKCHAPRETGMPCPGVLA